MTLLEALNNDSKTTQKKTIFSFVLGFFIFIPIVAPAFLPLLNNTEVIIGVIMFTLLYIVGCIVSLYIISTNPQRIIQKYSNTYSSEERAQIELGIQNGYIIHNFMVTPHYLIYIKDGNLTIIPYTAIINLYVDQQANSGKNTVAIALLFGLLAGLTASNTKFNNYQLFIETLAGQTHTLLLPKKSYNDYTIQDLLNRIQERRNSHYYEQIATPPTTFATRFSI